jgi:hypothetical protein
MFLKSKDASKRQNIQVRETQAKISACAVRIFT